MPFPGTLSPQQEDIFEESGAVFFQAGDVVLLSFVFFFFFSLLFCLIHFNPAQSSEHRKRVFLDCVWYILVHRITG